jgi:gliding motility-associated-like protein
MKKQILFDIGILFLPFGMIINVNAQSFSPEVIGSAGIYAASASGSMAWTIGEVTIDTYSSSGNFFTQGFHQPDKKPEEVIMDFFIPEGFSPNGDGTNDLFVIRGVDNYPHNKFEIYNRWGNKVFEASPYKSTWDGRAAFGVRMGGDKLPISTYFYLFDFGNGADIIKGTIYLNR